MIKFLNLLEFSFILDNMRCSNNLQNHQKELKQRLNNLTNKNLMKYKILLSGTPMTLTIKVKRDKI